MENGIVLFLGALRHGEFESLLERDIPCGALIDSNTKLHLPDLGRFQVVERFDFLRPETELLGKLQELRAKWGLRCMINVVEHYVAAFSRLAPELGVRGISPCSAQLCLDKLAMRQRFLERIGPHATGRFQEVRTEEQLRAFAAQVGFPLVLKPGNLSASLFISLNHTLDELLASYRRMVAEVPRYYQQAAQKGKTLAIQVEEFMAGSNHSIDCWIDAAGHVSTTPVVDVLTGADVGIDDFHHFAHLTPSHLSREQQAEASRLAIAGVEALEMSTVIGHVEFIQTPAGPKLLEIGARPGGNRIRILDMTYGIDQLFAYYEILCGRSPAVQPRKEQPSAIVTPFPRGQGVLHSFRDLDRLQRLPTYLYHEVRGRVGQTVGLAKDGFKAPLYVELTAPHAGRGPPRRGPDRFLGRLDGRRVTWASRSQTTRTVWIACLGIGLLFMARGAFVPYFFPIFEHLTDLSYGEISLLLNLYVFSQSVCAPLAGLFTDRTSVRTAVVTSIALGVLGFVVMLHTDCLRAVRRGDGGGRLPASSSGRSPSTPCWSIVAAARICAAASPAGRWC